MIAPSMEAFYAAMTVTDLAEWWQRSDAGMRSEIVEHVTARGDLAAFDLALDGPACDCEDDS